MVAVETNLKIVSTERKIQTAFIKLVMQEGFDRLTVQQLSQMAQINRGTFYLHYLDKFDLLTHYEDELVTVVQAIFERYPKPRDQSMDERNAFQQMFKYLYRQKQLVVALINSPASQLVSRIKPVIATVIGQPTLKTAIPPEFAQEIVTQGIWDFVCFWLTQDPVKPPQEAYVIFTASRQLSPQQLLQG
ncbi:TetR family transcriptional regulator [Lactobacillus sp. ZJLC29-4]|uniref:TetR family transcriptional regulator n=1 Tax=Levilactobacillus tujiorum TaxID=2912243 RepID=A0ABX1L7S2_9LACO|nr:TetR family transcriptional regulator [Lactobacillus sp. HBUAS51387]NLR30323.1 TetR family transcriptional regulator [Levilactobacillus tujiorum]